MNSQPSLRFAYHIVIIYFLTGTAWIIFSDMLVGKLFPPELFEAVSIAKGGAFIVVTSSILALLLLRHHRTQVALERRLREIINNLPSVLYVFDRNGKLVLFNRAMAELYGLDPENHKGKSREELGISDEAAAAQRADDLRVIEKGQALFFEEESLKEDGFHSYLTVKFPLSGSDGSIEAVCGVSTDITERKQLEEQLRQSQKMEAVGQLAGGMAHDFNNILSVIMGYCYMLQMGPNLDGQQQEKVNHVIAAAEKAAQLTRGLLSFSRKQVLTLQTVNLNDIVQHFQKFLTRIIGEDIHLQAILADIDLPVSVDSGQIEQVLVNLATNARDAMTSGGLLTLETEHETVDAAYACAHGCKQGGRYAVITVSDTGSGMSAETQKRIFEPFFTTKETEKGTGLGMSIVYGIVNQHNGFITLYSDPGKGSSFRIYLPLVERKPVQPAEPLAPVSPVGGKETILVAEDEASVAKLVASILTEFGYKVILAVDGEDAVAKFAANPEKIKLVLMDMIMPKKNGKAAAAEIRKTRPEVRILFTSGYTAEFMRDRGVEEEGMELIMKPVQPNVLLRRVREMLDR